MVFLKWILGYNKPPKYCDADVEFFDDRVAWL